MMPEKGRDQIRKHDAILFGSAGHPGYSRPRHAVGPAPGDLRQPFDQYANVRPTRVLPGITSPLRHVNGERTRLGDRAREFEGEYSGVGGRVHQGSPLEAATDVSMFTRAGVERILRFAFKLAQSRPRKLLTVVTKSNAQRHAMVMWDEIAARGRARLQGRDLGQDAGRRHDHAHGDEARRASTRWWRPTCTPTCSRISPRALAGSLGIAPTANLNPERAFLDVRADPRVGLRHHGQGRGQPCRDLLVGGDDAGASGRDRPPPDA